VRLKPLRDQVVVVTGASSGIGLATARRAARRGARVVLAARSGEVLEDIAREIGPRALAVVADVGERRDIETLAERAVATFGGIDAWVNVAGLTVYGPLREITQEDHERLIRTNFWGTVNGSLVAAEYLRARGGALINVGSIASDLAFPFQGLYAASKHAVKGFTDTLRMELIAEGAPVSVTLVKPASINTPLPEEVAAAILHAAEHAVRDIVVGGGGKLFTAGKEFAPGAFDQLAPAIIAMQKRKGPPRAPEGALHAPRAAGRERGDQPGYVQRTSAYTRASLHPLASSAIGIGVAATVAALALGGRRRS
jgi:NAD(P)-dependent dehydrogenase (short-subunit alcohol dehydrogenase family)